MKYEIINRANPISGAAVCQIVTINGYMNWVSEGEWVNDEVLIAIIVCNRTLTLNN